MKAIYRFIYAQIARTNDGSWRHYLPRAKSKRGWRGRKGGSSALHIKDRVADRTAPRRRGRSPIPGHWEADLMLFAAYGQAILVVHERASRLLVLARQPDKAAAHRADNLAAMLEPLPTRLRQTITFDNGTEFAQHYTPADNSESKPSSAIPTAPGKKAASRTPSARMRRFLPRKTDLAALHPKDLKTSSPPTITPHENALTSKPQLRSSLALLHFKCESTFPLSRE